MNKFLETEGDLLPIEKGSVPTENTASAAEATPECEVPAISKGNLPLETGATEDSDEILDSLSGGMGDLVLETLLPKITKFIGPMYKKLEDYLGDDEKLIMIRTNGKGKPTKAFVINTNKKFAMVLSPNKAEKSMTGEPGCIEHAYEGMDFVEALINGDFTKLEKLAKGKKG